jgi:transposase InsO family protein
MGSNACACPRYSAFMAIPQGRHLRWSLDFVADTLVNGRRFRILALVDDFTRECLGLVVDTSLTGLRVVRELDRIVIPSVRRFPAGSNTEAFLQKRPG